MPFQPGNRWWEARSKHGRNGKFSSGDELKQACSEYFSYVTDNPLWEDKVSFYQGVPSHDNVAKMQAMTIQGLCLFIGITTTTWYAWKSDKEHDFTDIIAWAEAVIYHQKLTGAAADLLNANIISRELGLADKSEVSQKATVKVAKDMTPEEAARAYQEMMNGG